MQGLANRADYPQARAWRPWIPIVVAAALVAGAVVFLMKPWLPFSVTQAWVKNMVVKRGLCSKIGLVEQDYDGTWTVSCQTSSGAGVVFDVSRRGVLLGPHSL